MPTPKFQKLWHWENHNRRSYEQARYVPIQIWKEKNDLGCWDLESISADAVMQFTLTYFKEEFQNRGVHLTFAAPGHQEMNGHV